MDIRLSRRVGILVIATLLLASTVAAAKSTNLVTGVASARASDELGCILSNVGTTSINVEFTLVNISSGEVAHTLTEPVGPDETQGFAGVGGGFLALCVFTFEGLANNVRANLLITAADGETLAVLEAR